MSLWANLFQYSFIWLHINFHFSNSLLSPPHHLTISFIKQWAESKYWHVFICRQVRFLFWELCFHSFRDSTEMPKCTYLPKPIKPCWSRNAISCAASAQSHIFLVPSMNFKQQETLADSVSLFSFLPVFLFCLWFFATFGSN